MKTELLATANALLAQVNAMPDDPPPPATPTGLAVVNTYGSNPLTIEIGWDQIEDGCIPILENKGADGNAAGPQQWTSIFVNGGSPDPDGARANLVLQNPDGQNILFRLKVQRLSDGQQSDVIQIPFPST